MAKLTPQSSTVLPMDAREALIAASKLPDPRQRARAIQEATERAQQRHPQFFKRNQGATQ